VSAHTVNAIVECKGRVTGKRTVVVYTELHGYIAVLLEWIVPSLMTSFGGLIFIKRNVALCVAGLLFEKNKTGKNKR
jgi:hypothetical protein